VTPQPLSTTPSTSEKNDPGNALYTQHLNCQGRKAHRYREHRRQAEHDKWDHPADPLWFDEQRE
jgi:hypothetical protein